ncbi:hypothetical protein FHX42_001616 [Saccharopolyspora lacisalsi]|uniref:Uncharacterized protein n=1 Tax=Halosaccharopolyspora lacisalsi TaxID=1000566 RepID=A0A839DU53_9PSEU|nr:hypothetical protein [Halosaccharopolyspora lacisalsi]
MELEPVEVTRSAVTRRTTARVGRTAATRDEVRPVATIVVEVDPPATEVRSGAGPARTRDRATAVALVPSANPGIGERVAPSSATVTRAPLLRATVVESRSTGIVVVVRPAETAGRTSVVVRPAATVDPATRTSGGASKDPLENKATVRSGIDVAMTGPVGVLPVTRRT